MDLTAAVDEIAAAIRDASVGVVACGSGTQREVGNPTASGCDEVNLPAGILAHDPQDMTVTAAAGTTVADLNATLVEYGQEVVFDVRDPHATIGGALAVGLSGVRRLRHGPLRDTVLEVQFVDGRGELVKGGGKVVKNVTGYDIPRLLVGSIGTLGVMVQVTLRCRPRAESARWYCSDRPLDALRSDLYRPSAVLWDGEQTSVLLEGYGDDLATEANRAGLVEVEPPDRELVRGAHRGRISVPLAAAEATARSLRANVVGDVVAELGVGTIHVASDTAEDLVAARSIAHRNGGWMLRERGGPEGFCGFGVIDANAQLSARVRDAFDPQRRLAPGRLERR